MNDKQNQAQWQAHTLDESRAIDEQQSRAGPTHEPVKDSVGDRLQSGIDTAALAERQRCVRIVQAWREPARLQREAGPIDDAATATVQRVLAAIESELRGELP